MTKLRDELLKAIQSNSNDLVAASMAEEVAKRYIEKAYKDGFSSRSISDHPTFMEESKTDWLKENGVTGEVNS